MAGALINARFAAFIGQQKRKELMQTIDFPQCWEVLTQAQLPARLKHSFQITIRWYLSFCKRGRAAVTVQSARDFIDWAAQQKHPQDWQRRTVEGRAGKSMAAGKQKTAQSRQGSISSFTKCLGSLCF